MTWQTTQQFGYPKNGCYPHIGYGIFSLIAAPFMVVTGWDFAGFVAPMPVVYVISAGCAILGVWLLITAAARLRSNDPAVEITEDRIRLHIHPGRPMELRREDIVRVEEVRNVPTTGFRASYGQRGFRIRTTASGMRSMILFVGERMVDAPLEEVHAAVRRFVEQ